jgi:hypothetical protein
MLWLVIALISILSLVLFNMFAQPLRHRHRRQRQCGHPRPGPNAPANPSATVPLRYG